MHNSLLLWGCILLFVGLILLLVANAKKHSTNTDDQKQAKNFFIAGGVIAGVGAVCIGGGFYMKQRHVPMVMPAQTYNALQE